MKSNVNSCMVSHAHSDHVQLKSEEFAVTALIHVTETEIFCRRYLKINNSTVKEYFSTKFRGFRDIFRIQGTNFVRIHSDLACLSNVV